MGLHGFLEVEITSNLGDPVGWLVGWVRFQEVSGGYNLQNLAWTFADDATQPAQNLYLLKLIVQFSCMYPINLKLLMAPFQCLLHPHQYQIIFAHSLYHLFGNMMMTMCPLCQSGMMHLRDLLNCLHLYTCLWENPWKCPPCHLLWHFALREIRFQQRYLSVFLPHTHTNSPHIERLPMQFSLRRHDLPPSLIIHRGSPLFNNLLHMAKGLSLQLLFIRPNSPLQTASQPQCYDSNISPTYRRHPVGLQMSDSAQWPRHFFIIGQLAPNSAECSFFLS